MFETILSMLAMAICGSLVYAHVAMARSKVRLRNDIARLALANSRWQDIARDYQAHAARLQDIVGRIQQSAVKNNDSAMIDRLVLLGCIAELTNSVNARPCGECATPECEPKECPNL